jgi:hypothetical protein
MWVVLLLLAVACELAAAPQVPTRFVTGSWGGDGISFRANAQGAQIHYDCNNARIATPIALDSTDHFDFTGAFTRIGGAQPVESSGEPSARFTGEVQGGTMHLKIMFMDSGETLGPFTLRQGLQVHLPRCS